MARSHQKEIIFCFNFLILRIISESINWSALESCGDVRKCISYNLCPELVTRIDVAEMSSSIPVSQRFGDDYGGCHDNLEVCCPEPFKVHPICSNVSARNRECGASNENGFNDNNNKLIAGFAEFPWIVAIFEDSWALTKSYKFFRNTGSLIHSKVVISSAVEIADISTEKLVVRAGEWNLQSVSEMCKHEDRGVAKVIKHDEYNDNNFQNNLALIILEKEFQLSPIINIVCIPPKNTEFHQERCILSGWDKKGSAYADKAILKKSETYVVSNYDCEEKLKNTMLGSNFKLHEKFLCAEGRIGIDLSEFSGGSLLMCPISSHPKNLFLTGIAVGCFTCAFKNIPEIYADLTKQRDWIDEQILVNGIGYLFDNI